MARRYKSLHHNLKEGENVVFHREHRSKKNRKYKNPFSLKKIRWEMEQKMKKNRKYLEY